MHLVIGFASDATHQVEKTISSASSDLLLIPSGPITRARAKRFKEALNGLIKDIWAKSLQLSRRICPLFK